MEKQVIHPTSTLEEQEKGLEGSQDVDMGRSQELGDDGVREELGNTPLSKVGGVNNDSQAFEGEEGLMDSHTSKVASDLPAFQPAASNGQSSRYDTPQQLDSEMDKLENAGTQTAAQDGTQDGQHSGGERHDTPWPFPTSLRRDANDHEALKQLKVYIMTQSNLLPLTITLEISTLFLEFEDGILRAGRVASLVRGKGVEEGTVQQFLRDILWYWRQIFTHRIQYKVEIDESIFRGSEMRI